MEHVFFQTYPENNELHTSLEKNYKKPLIHVKMHLSAELALYIFLFGLAWSMTMFMGLRTYNRLKDRSIKYFIICKGKKYKDSIRTRSTKCLP